MPAMSVEAMQDAVLAWYSQTKRDLPWRRTHDPYAILVSEVMLHQTQVTRVVPRYEAWLRRWPTIAALAAAPAADAIAEWSGLGYNRRAVLLHRCAREVVALGGFPRSLDELRRLPGIGPYTAAAIACFAFGAQVAAPDTNARRVLERAFPGRTVDPPRGHAYAWNQALFDLGREVCLARRPRCGACPIAAACPSRGRTYPPLRRQSRFEGSFRQRRARLLRAVATAGPIPEAGADAEALVSLVRDGLAEVAAGWIALPGQTSAATSAVRPVSEGSSASGA
ncbi:MAG TPA: A/G-specific adenine glycosylase [Gaiellales bacterium]|jgi:A/G-specific adenine glycosylase|nr:A/G-specific adenine glycosylase [Gaiellales bacterium]